MMSYRFNTVDDVCDFIRQNSMLGEWKLEGQRLRTINGGFCPVCWVAKKLNPASKWTTAAMSAMSFCDWPMSGPLATKIISLADAGWFCEIEERKKLLKACGLVN